MRALSSDPSAYGSLVLDSSSTCQAWMNKLPTVLRPGLEAMALAIQQRSADGSAARLNADEALRQHAEDGADALAALVRAGEALPAGTPLAEQFQAWRSELLAWSAEEE